MNMDKKSDDFKATAMGFLGHSEAWRLTTRERRVLWRLAFNARELTAGDSNELKIIADKLQPESVA